LAWDWFRALPPNAVSQAAYVGRQTCAECHQGEHKLWQGSDHDQAMMLATDQSVLADFNDTKFEYQGVTTRFFRRDGKFMVNTEGPDGKYHDYEVKYTFGVRPLQQYMVEFPDGRVQVLRESWDVKNKKWFYVTPPDVPNERIPPGDPLHWTGIAQNWNTTCADCHSTNLHKGYDPEKNTYHTTFAQINVSCEECHGPGSVHVELARKRSPFWDRNVGYGLVSLKNKFSNTMIETCAKCHSRRYQVHEDFRPGRSFLDHYEPVTLAAGLYEADGQIRDEVYEYGSFMQSKMHANRVRCTDCHDPHSLKLKFTGNALCTQCHLPAKYDTPAHHHHKADSEGAQCIKCHMPSRLYMVIDERRDHSFRPPRPDLSVELGTPNACNDCHKKSEETFQWAADAVRKWYGDKRPADYNWGAALKAGRSATPEGEKLLLGLLSNRETPPIVRATAIDLLANYNSPAVTAARREALSDSDPLVRLNAVRGLDAESTDRLIPHLAKMLDDRVRAIRIAAAGRLAHLPLDRLTDDQRRSFEKAMLEFLESQKLGLDHAGGHLTLGSLDRQHGRLDEAVGHYQAAIALEPYMAGPRSELASLLEQGNGDPAKIRRLRQEEADLVERDAKLAPDNAAIFYRLGLLRYTLDEYDKADAALNQACMKAPNNYDFRMTLALLQEKRYEQTSEEKYFNDAAHSIKKLVDMQPKDERAKQIFLRLMQTYQAKHPEEAKPTGQPPIEN
jgi:predicted CXXCH cytochrome family protein